MYGYNWNDEFYLNQPSIKRTPPISPIRYTDVRENYSRRRRYYY